MTFEEWHKANAKYMEPADFYPWLADAFEAGRQSVLGQPEQTVIEKSCYERGCCAYDHRVDEGVRVNISAVKAGDAS